MKTSVESSRLEMRGMRLSFAWWLLAAATALHSRSVVACEANITEYPSIVSYSGCISRAHIDKLLVILGKESQKILQITSEGGDVDSAIRLAEELIVRPRRISFSGICNSSCANYLLPVASPAVVADSASFLLHGDAELTINRHLDKASKFPVESRLEIERILTAERRLRDRAPAVDYVHQVQRVAMAPTSTYVKINVGLGVFECRGLGLVQWKLDRSLLDRIAPGWVPVRSDSSGEDHARSSSSWQPAINPLSGCRVQR